MLRARLQVAEETLRALTKGEVDAIVRPGPAGEQIFTLKGADEPYRVMVETMSEGAVTLTRDGVILYCNRQFADLVKHGLEQVIGSSMRNLVVAGDCAKFEAMMRRSDAELIRDSIRLLRPDGQAVTIYLALRNLRTDGVDSLVGVVTDLSGLRLIEKSRDELARIVDSAQDCIVGEDANGFITSWNKGAERIYGYTAEEIVGKNVKVFFPLGHENEFSELMQRIRRGENVASYESERITKLGKRITLALTHSPIMDEAGKVAGVSTIAMDITELKRAQAEVMAASRYARSLIEASLDPMVVISAEGKITDVNKATEDATGIVREKLIGTDFADYFTDREKATLGYLHAFAEGAVSDYALSLRHRSGKIMNVLYNARVYRDAGGEVAGLFAAARDVTEVMRDEDELRKHRLHLEDMVAERTRELAESNKEMEAFAYSVSHDLRAPLRAIDGFSGILLEDYADKLDPEGQRLLHVVRDSTAKMGRMIDDVLAFSRAGRTEMNTEPLSMEALVGDAIKDLETATAGRRVRFEIGPLPDARGDGAMLQRVWVNLLDNAIKYSAPKPDARIEIGANQSADETAYFVRDNGVGFDMKYVDKLFGVFQRLHGSEFPGTGIGLAIVKRIVTRHGGRVWAEGKPNEGATLYFALPKR